MRAFKDALAGFSHYLNCSAEAYEGVSLADNEECIDGAMDRENFESFMADQINNICPEISQEDFEAEIEEIRQIGIRLIPGAFA